MSRSLFRAAGLAGGVLMLSACGGGPSESPDAALPDAMLPDARPDAQAPDAGVASHHHFVSDTVIVPESSAQVRDLGLNIDGDANNRPDNAFGGILAALRQQNVDVQISVNDALASGRLVWLHDLQASSLVADPAASWRIYQGLASTTPPRFDGTDAFELDPTATTSDVIEGKIVQGQFEGGPGAATLLVAVGGGAPMRLHLVGARLRARVSATGCSEGVLGGAITVEDLNQQVLPGLQELFNRRIGSDGPDGLHPAACSADDMTCPVSPAGESTSCDSARNLCVSSAAKTLLALFDSDKDGVIELDEIQNNTLVRALLAPDVDLFDATGMFNPLVDGVHDSLSIGVGFTCKPAAFTVAGE
jgi:hypothetical protein